MPSIKEYDVKLKSLKNTQKMTKTMKMVSASKLRRAQEAQRNAMDYAARVEELIARLAASVESAAHPLLEQRPAKRALILLYTSDRGLCAGFNNNLIKFVQHWLADNTDRYPDGVDVSFCGRRGFAHFKRRVNVKNNYEDSTAVPDFMTAREIGREIRKDFEDGVYDEVYLAYNHFKSALSQEPTLNKLLPVEANVLEGGEKVNADYIFEPAQEEMLKSVLPRAVYFKIYNAFLENSAGEHGARMTAMDNATNNAQDLIKTNTLRRNRARQAAITTELTEIVAGAEAL
jgi:F-type H+-transporting ATPase subunit gamma